MTPATGSPGSPDAPGRPLLREDAVALYELIAAHDVDLLGVPDTSLDDVRVDLADPGLDPSSRVVEAAGGRLDAALRIWVDGSSGHADVDVVTRPGSPPQLFASLLDEARSAVLERVRGDGSAQAVLDHFVYEGDARTARTLADAGYRPATSFFRMRRELDAPVELLQPPGVTVRLAPDLSLQTLRLTHRLHQESFAGHFGFVAQSWEEWHTTLQAREESGPLWFARVDGQDSGFLQESQSFVPELDAGYVLRLGVLRAARCRGVARALLLAAFARMRADGRRAVLLHVDVANATGALSLYESVGMRCVLQMDAWRLQLDLG